MIRTPGNEHLCRQQNGWTLLIYSNSFAINALVDEYGLILTEKNKSGSMGNFNWYGLFSVTKQRDQESGQQSLLFQVKMLDNTIFWVLDLIFTCFQCIALKNKTSINLVLCFFI